MRAFTSKQRGLLAAVLGFLLGPIVVWMVMRGVAKNPPAPSGPANAPDGEPVAAFRQEEIHFASGENMLAGALALPVTAGPHPAVVFVHGSGSLGRDDWTLHPPLRDELARQGIASLYWDKPGVGASNGDWTQQSFHDRAREVLDAIKFLRGRNDIDHKRVGLWGISQGGWICPLAASRSPDIAFIILVSAPAGTIAQQELFRVEQGMRVDGMPHEDIDRARDFALKRLQLIRIGTFEQLDALQQEVADQTWFKDYVHRLGPKDFAFGAKNVAYDGRSSLNDVKCPVLILVGERDTIVPSKESAATIKSILTKAGNLDVTVKEFPAADHFLQQTKTGGPREMLAGGSHRTFAPGYFSVLSTWLGERLAMPRASPTARTERALGQIRDGDWQAAAQNYSTIVRLNPYRADHWHNYAYALYKCKRFEEAILAWEKAAQLGFAWDPLWERGLVWEKAWVTGFGPGTPLPWYNIARAQAQLGRADDALRSLGRALEEGFADDDSLQSDIDLASLREDPRYRLLTGLFPPEGLSREERWRYDLDYLARRLDQMHCNIGAKNGGESPRAAIRSLRERLPALKDHQVVVEIQRVMALAGDGHTRLLWPHGGAYAIPRYPTEYYLYADGLFVRRASRDLAEAAGARVVKIGGLSAEQALKAVEPFCSVDGPMGFKAEAPRLLARPDILQSLGIADEMNCVALVLELQSGRQITIKLAPARSGSEAPENWTSINAHALPPLPSYLRNREKAYWFEHLPEARLVYMQYNAVADQKEETLDQFCLRMMAFIAANGVEHLAIDLRHNGGGNGLLNRALIRELIQSDALNRKGHLFVILGRNTFSAAMGAATDLERMTECLFVGEPSCSSPNARGQANPIKLPCSGLHLSCASLYYQGALLSSDRRPWIAPDLVAELTSTDEANNRDPALCAILAEIRSR